MPTPTFACQTKYGTGLALGFTSINPANGAAAGGTNVTISGSGFITDGDGTAQVFFNATAATNVVVVNDGSITCTTPAHAVGAVDVTIVVLQARFRVANGFTYV